MSDFANDLFCSDTCKFLHDRSDYKAGWQIDKEWNEMQKKRQEKLVARKEGKVTEEKSSSSDDSDD